MGIKLRVISGIKSHFLDGYFFVGRGPNVAPDAGIKVPIKGRDTPNMYVCVFYAFNFLDDWLWEYDKIPNIPHIYGDRPRREMTLSSGIDGCK